MTLKRVLNELVKVVLEEADKNKDFAARLDQVFSQTKKVSKSPSNSKTVAVVDGKSEILGATRKDQTGTMRRPSNRRSPAMLDPVQIARNDPNELQVKLQKLSIEQLLDVVAEYGMDTGKMVMKWKDSSRIIERIIEVSMSRAHKGDAFRSPQDNVERPAAHDIDSSGSDVS